MNRRNYFSLLVIGDFPDVQIKPFGPDAEPVAVMQKSDLKNLRKSTINEYKDVIEKIKADKDFSESTRDYAMMLLQTRLDKLMALNDEGFWLAITEGYDVDDETQTAYINNAKYEVITRAKFFAMPFIDKNGSETYSARKNEIDWRMTDDDGTNDYIVAWETVVEGRKPKDKNEAHIYNVMKGHRDYMLGFGNKDNYVESGTKFWTFSVLMDGKWVDLDDSSDDNQFEWVRNYHKRFISGLPDDTLLTLYEYKKTLF